MEQIGKSLLKMQQDQVKSVPPKPLRPKVKKTVIPSPKDEAKVALSKAEENVKTEWAWKKKTPEDLARTFNPSQAQNKPDQRFQLESSLEQQDDLKNDHTPDALDEIYEITNRLNMRNADKEHQRKIEEYERFMEDMQEFLNKPISAEEDPDLWKSMIAQQMFEERCEHAAPKEGRNKKLAAVTLTNIEAIKSK